MKTIINFVASKRRYHAVTEYLMFEDGTIVKCTTFPNLKF